MSLELLMRLGRWGYIYLLESFLCSYILHDLFLIHIFGDRRAISRQYLHREADAFLLHCHF